MVPGQRALAAQRVKCIADLSCMTVKSRQVSHLSVGRNAATGNASHHGVDLLVARPRSTRQVSTSRPRRRVLRADFVGGTETQGRPDVIDRHLCDGVEAVSYTHLRAHETPEHLVCRLLL